jgi:hypothetical protein
MSADRDHNGPRSHLACEGQFTPVHCNSCPYTAIHAGTRWFTMNGCDHSLFSTCNKFCLIWTIIHFGAWHADPQDIEDFGLDDMSNDYAWLAPRVWSLLDAVLVAKKRKTSLLLESRGSGDTNTCRQSANVDASHEIILEGASGPHSPDNQPVDPAKRKDALIQIVCAYNIHVCCSVLT